LLLSEAQGREVGHGELGEALLVELGLEVLSSQSAGNVRFCFNEPKQ
jgi:hypothetical protein